MSNTLPAADELLSTASVEALLRSVSTLLATDEVCGAAMPLELDRLIDQLADGVVLCRLVSGAAAACASVDSDRVAWCSCGLFNHRQTSTYPARCHLLRDLFSHCFTVFRSFLPHSLYWMM